MDKMRVYVKSVGTNITMVDIDSGDKFSVAAASVAKLFGVEFKEGEVWDINASKLDDIAEAFRKWQMVQQA
jgi:aminoglycoside N3'-acetyltransferase